MDIQSLLAKHHFNFYKGFGQNFLTDPALLQDIVERSGIVAGDTVIEIGAGAGTLTREIAKVAGRVIAFEIDRHLEPILQEVLSPYDNVQVVMTDIMTLSMSDIEAYAGGQYKVVANIPYYITSPLLMMFVEQGTMVDSLTLTIQNEVADRLVAQPATKAYGALTVAVDIVADSTKIMSLPRQLFCPVPNVDSAVVKVDMHRDKYHIGDMPLLKQLYKCGFAMRRKTLVNNLMSAFRLDRPTATHLLEECGIAINVRGEQLHSSQYVLLSQCLSQYID